jgi:hypothetical protein
MATTMAQGEAAIAAAMKQAEKDAQDPAVVGPKPSPAADQRPLTAGEPGRLP